MSPDALLALGLAVVAAIAMLRVALGARRRGDRGWRRVLLVAGQAGLAALLWCVLLPPAKPAAPGALVLLTEGADLATLAPAPGDRVLALPGAPDFDGAVPVPDLGTARRRHPDAGPVRVLGRGLPARDHDAAQGLGFSFLPAPLPPTLVALSPPQAPTRGRRFDLQGRIEGHAGGVVELLDPAGERIDRAALDEAGHFRLDGIAGPVGTADYRLQWRRGDDEPGEGLAVPLRVAEGAALRVLVVSGGASPELKFLRRWALDGGLALATQLRLGGGIVLGDDRGPLTAARLAGLDLVVLDERAWRALGAGGQATLREAVRGGLGLLLRLTADPSAAERRALADWGFELTPVDVPRSVRLPGTEHADLATPGSDDAETRATDTAPPLSRRPLQLTAADGRALVNSDAGDALALWRPEGRGRIAVWTLSDSYRLALTGRGSAYGSLWSGTFGTLARAHARATPPLPQDAWVGERSALCGLADDTALLDPSGRALPLVRDPGTGSRACAAFWPSQAGWHLRREGDQEDAFFVRAASDAPGLHAAHLRQATQALADESPGQPAGAATQVRGPRWPWLLGWLLLAGALWWLERSRAGRT